MIFLSKQGGPYEALCNNGSTESLQWQYSSDLLHTMQPQPQNLNNSDNVPIKRKPKSPTTSAAGLQHRRCSVYENVGL